MESDASSLFNIFKSFSSLQQEKSESSSFRGDALSTTSGGDGIDLALDSDEAQNDDETLPTTPAQRAMRLVGVQVPTVRSGSRELSHCIYLTIFLWRS